MQQSQDNFEFYDNTVYISTKYTDTSTIHKVNNTKAKKKFQGTDKEPLRMMMERRKNQWTCLDSSFVSSSVFFFLLHLILLSRQFFMLHTIMFVVFLSAFKRFIFLPLVCYFFLLCFKIHFLSINALVLTLIYCL